MSIDDDGGAPRLTVRDTGQGIAREFLPFVFERFRQANASTSRTEGGLGLGLALVRQLVELHGGRISAESAGRGQGSVFVVTFPEVKTDVAGDGGSPRPLDGRPLDNLRVFIIDDENDWRSLLTLALESLGAVVASARSSAEGLAELTAPGARTPDVILADIGMPGEDGYAFLEALRMNRGLADVPVIAVTAYAGDSNESRALAAGFKMQCTKPVDPDAVARAVLKVLRNQPA